MSKALTIKNLSSILIYLLPIFIISGNFLADLTVVIINILFVTLLIQNKSINYIYDNKYFWVLVVFYLYVVVRSLFTLEWISIKSAIFLFRYIIFIFAFHYLYINKVLNLSHLYSILIFLMAILFIDGSYQYVFKSNIFGYDLFHPDRVSSFFGDELIMGSYTFRVLLLIIPLSLFLNKNNVHHKNFLKLGLIILILVFLLILSGERTPFFLSLLYILSLIVILPQGFLNKLKLFLIFIISIIFIFNYNITFSKRLIDMSIKNFKNVRHDNNQKNFLSFSQMHDDHYSSGVEMFKDNILFGQGLKMFRIKCNEKKFNVGKFSCSTHPHNIIIQFIAELGIVGILFLIYFYFKLFSKLKTVKNNPLLTSTTFLVFLILFPFLPFGNFFHNGLVIMNILSISILWCLHNDNNKQY
ncbi:O-antigen ligase family protein [Candidatus Pelagibacter sp.]|nr:O-antigen ligase family protein [Candidatus Pelagibacter sp.]